jgi:hypothetical protein
MLRAGRRAEMVVAMQKFILLKDAHSNHPWLGFSWYALHKAARALW